MYDLIALVLYATIITGVAVVSLAINYVQAKGLPNLIYGVGMAIRDESIKEFGLSDLLGNNETKQGGRPAEGGLGALLHYAEKFGIIDKLMNKGATGSASQSFSPGIR